MVGVAADTNRLPFDEDSVYVRRFLSGDSSAFDSIYGRYKDKVFAVSKGILLDSEDAADSVQETFRLVYRGLTKFNQRSRLSTWIFRIAVNCAIQMNRRKKYKSKQIELEELADIAANSSEPASSDPKVSAAMAVLKPEDRALLSLFYWEELSLVEIGETLGCGANAAKTRLYRARERFREIYESIEDKT